MDLILASQSPRRRELLALLGHPFQAAAAQIDEGNHPDEPPPDMATRLALAKAQVVSALHPNAWIIGCDTIVADQNEILGKPSDETQARTILLSLRGRAHAVLTGVALVKADHAIIQQVETTVYMRDYAKDELDRYIASGDPMDKAGAYGIQHAAFHPVASWQGCYANVMGLPLCHLSRMLREVGLPTPVDLPTACQSHTNQPCAVFQDVLLTG